MTEDSPAALAKILYDVAVSTALSAAPNGRRFKQATAGGLRELTQMWAEEVIRPHRFAGRSSAEASKSIDERISDAKAAVAALVVEMARDAQSIKGYDKDKLGERTLAHALYCSSFCPCWPIC